MNEVAFVQPALTPVEESPSLAAMQPLAGVLISDYHLLPKVAGIYFIRNRLNGKFYIGSSVLGRRGLGIRGRVSTHLTHLVSGKHHSSKLQRSFNKNGVSAFDVGLLFLACNIPRCLECCENYFIQKFNAYKKGYNAAPKAYQPGFTPWTRNRRNNLKKSMSIAYDKTTLFGWALRQRLSNRFKGLKRGIRTEETTRKRSESLKIAHKNKVWGFAIPGTQAMHIDSRTEGIRRSLKDPEVLAARKKQLESVRAKKKPSPISQGGL